MLNTNRATTITRAAMCTGILLVLSAGLAPVPALSQQTVQAQAGVRTSAPIVGEAGGATDVSASDAVGRSGYFAVPRRGNVASHTWTPNEEVVMAKASSRQRHVAIGAVIGALVGAGTGIALSLPSGTEGSMIPPPLIIAGGALIGAGIGALIGAAAPSGH